LLDKVRSLRSHCMTTNSWDKHKGRSSAYDVDGLGLNYRPTDLSSALGRVQLHKLTHDRSQRSRLARTYHTHLGDIRQLNLPFADRNEPSAHHLLPILLGPEVLRSEFQAHLKAAGIQSSVHYPPTHLFSYYREHYNYQPGSLPITEDVCDREVSLPIHARMTEDQVLFVVETVRESLQQYA